MGVTMKRWQLFILGAAIGALVTFVRRRADPAVLHHVGHQVDLKKPLRANADHLPLAEH
jgi:hypothetical protein